MKIYTEINYELKDGELIEIDSEYFDYTGKLVLCGAAGDPDLGGSDDDDTASSTSSTSSTVSSDDDDDVDTTPTEDDKDQEIEEYESEEEMAEDVDTATGVGSAERVTGTNPYLAIKKKTTDQTGTYTRGSLRVKKPKPIQVAG